MKYCIRLTFFVGLNITYFKFFESHWINIKGPLHVLQISNMLVYIVLNFRALKGCPYTNSCLFTFRNDLEHIYGRKTPRNEVWSKERS